MSHDTSLRQLLSSTGYDGQSDRSLRANAGAGASGDVSLKKDFITESINIFLCVINVQSF